MSDIVFEDSPNQIKVLCDNMWIAGHDLLLDSVARRQPAHTAGPLGFRRALVHDQGDGLTINFNHDYPGGVALNGPLAIMGEVAITVHRRAASATGQTTITETLNLVDEIDTLKSQVRDLQARVAILESK